MGEGLYDVDVSNYRKFLRVAFWLALVALGAYGLVWAFVLLSMHGRPRMY